MQQKKQLQYLLDTFFPHNFQKLYLFECSDVIRSASSSGTVLQLSKHKIEIKGWQPQNQLCSCWRIPRTDFKFYYWHGQQSSLFCLDFFDQVIAGYSSASTLDFKTPQSLKRFHFPKENSNSDGVEFLFSSREPTQKWLEFVKNEILHKQKLHPLSEIVLSPDRQYILDMYWYEALQNVPSEQRAKQLWQTLEKGYSYLHNPTKGWSGKTKNGGYEALLSSGFFEGEVCADLQKHWNLLSQPLLENRFKEFLWQPNCEWLAFFILAHRCQMPWAKIVAVKIGRFFRDYLAPSLVAKWNLLLFLLENVPVYKSNDGYEVHGLSRPATGTVQRDFGVFSFKSTCQKANAIHNTLWLRSGLKIHIDKEAVFSINDKQDVVRVFHPLRKEPALNINWFKLDVDGLQIEIDLAWPKIVLEVGVDRFKLLFKGRRYQLTIRKRSKFALEVDGHSYRQKQEHATIYKSIKKSNPVYNLKFYDFYGAEISESSLYPGQYIVGGSSWNSYGQVARALTLRKTDLQKATTLNPIYERVKLGFGDWSVNMKSESPYVFRIGKEMPLIGSIFQTKAALAPFRVAIVTDPEFDNEQLLIQKKFYTALGIWLDIFDLPGANRSGATFIFQITRIEELVLEKQKGPKKTLLIDYGYLDEYLNSFRK